LALADAVVANMGVVKSWSHKLGILFQSMTLIPGGGDKSLAAQSAF
jgi:hypothetical protein